MLKYGDLLDLILMNKTKPFFCIMLFFVTLAFTGCSHLTNQPALDCLQHAKPDTLNCWAVRGKLGFKSPQKTGSVYLYWQQKNQTFTINLSGPLGQGAAVIEGKAAGQVMLRQAGQQDIIETDARAVFFRHFGWDLPLPQLLYWIQGQTAPSEPITHIRRNDINQITSLAQMGWELHFSRYNSEGLPGKIAAQADSLNLTFIIQEWITNSFAD